MLKYIKASLLVLLSLWSNMLLGDGINANVAEVILTPPIEMGYSLGGYGARMSKPAEGIHDDIRAKALVMQDGEFKYAIITLDILGLPPNVKPLVVERLNDINWTEENIMLLPSHSHTSLEMLALNDKNVFNLAPIGVFQQELLEFVVDKLSNLIKAADHDLKPVKIGTSRLVLDDLNRNRREQPFVDRDLTVTRVDLTNGMPMCVLVNWTAHPTIMDDDDMWVSGGWPGYLQRELEALIGDDVLAMYYNGAEGDQSVIAGGGGSHYEKAERYGRTIALEAFKVYNDTKAKGNAKLSYNYETIALPAREPHPGFMATGGKEYGLNEENIMILLNAICPETTGIGAVKIGDLLIIGAPGEMIAEMGIDIKNNLQKSGIKYAVIGGLANEWISYILTEEEYSKSGYEASVSFYGKMLGAAIHDGMIKTASKITE
jgi:hypothetical protein